MGNNRNLIKDQYVLINKKITNHYRPHGRQFYTGGQTQNKTNTTNHEHNTNRISNIPLITTN